MTRLHRRIERMRRLRALALVAILLSPLAMVPIRAALPATDNCDSSGSLNGNWTVTAGTFEYNGTGHCRTTADVDVYNFAKWTGDAFNNDQYAQAVMPIDTGYGGPCVRLAGTSRGTMDGYCVQKNAVENTTQIMRMDDGSANALGASYGDPGESAVVRLEISGSTLTLKFDNVAQGTTRSDGTYSTGVAGVVIYSFGGQRFDDFQADNLTAAATCGSGLLLLGAGKC